MKKYVADSSCDIFSYGDITIEAAPLTIYTDEVSYTDDNSMNISEMLDVFKNYKGRSYTACPGTETWLNAFEGGDEIYVATMTSGLSGTYNSAMVAKEMYEQEHPEAKIAVFDTLSTGPELRLVMEKVIELSQSGLVFEEVCAQVTEYMKHTRLFFALKSLHNMGQNGRVSKVLVSAVGLLGISILGTASEEGKLKPITKCRGDKKFIAHMMKELVEAGYSGGRVRIGHVENPELAKRLKSAIHLEFPHADIKEYSSGGLCSYYGERGGILIGCETE